MFGLPDASVRNTAIIFVIALCFILLSILNTQYSNVWIQISTNQKKDLNCTHYLSLLPDNYNLNVDSNCINNILCSSLSHQLSSEYENTSWFKNISHISMSNVTVSKSNAWTYPIELNRDGNCTEYAASLSHRFVTYNNIINTWNDSQESAGDVTVLTRLSWNRIHSLKRLILSWDGPVSATVYTEDWLEKAAQLMQWIQGINRTNIQIHIVIQYGDYYPVNYLRNVAQSNAVTQFVFMVDVDFVTMSNMYLSLKRHLKTFYNQDLGKKVLVMPTFAFVGNVTLPQSKDDIKRQWKKHVKLFRYDYSLKRGALYNSWIKSNTDIKLPYQKNAECFYVIEKSYSPDYDEMFLQRWQNKVVHVYTLHAKGFRFWIYSQGFILHLPHKEVKGEPYMKSKQCALDYYYKRFIPDLQKTYHI